MNPIDKLKLATLAFKNLRGVDHGKPDTSERRDNGAVDSVGADSGSTVQLGTYYQRNSVADKG